MRDFRTIVLGPRVALEMAQDEAISALREYRVELFRRIERQRAEAPQVDLNESFLDGLMFDETAPTPIGNSRPTFAVKATHGSLPAPCTPAKPKRVRRPTVAQIEREAGRPVSALTVARDGSWTYALGRQEAAKEAAKEAEEPPRTTLFKARPVPKMKVVL